MDTRSAITVLSRFLGAGNTTRLKHARRHRDGERVAVIVNDISEVNIDAALVRDGGAALSRTEENRVAFSNGCIGCTPREDLREEVERLAAERRFDYMPIESTGMSEPMPVTATFTVRDDSGFALADAARRDTMVTVVNSEGFARDFGAGDRLRDRGEVAGPDDQRALVNRLANQVELADVIVLSRADTASREAFTQTERLVQALNRDAAIIVADRDRVPLERILGTDRFAFVRAQPVPGWVMELRGERRPETEQVGITSFVYCTRKPFHPQRFHRSITEGLGGVVRSKGFFWLASRMDWVGELSTVGLVTMHQAAGFCFAAAHRTEAGRVDAPIAAHEALSAVPPSADDVGDPAEYAAMHRLWDRRWGDRRQQIAVTGVGLNGAAITAEFDACLLTRRAVAAGPARWQRDLDPFPPWRWRRNGAST